MIWIELLGPSGIGKSYWYNKFIEKYPEYEPQKLLLKRIYENKRKLNISFKIELLFIIYNLKIPKISNFFKLYLFHYFINSFSKGDEIYKKDNIIVEKYLNSINLYNEPSVSLIEKIHYFSYKLKEFRVFEAYLNKDDIYIAEDGLLYLSPIYFKELQPDFAIILKRNKEDILEQRKRRAQQNPRLMERLFKGKKLNNYLDNYFLLYEKKLSTLDTEKILLLNIKNDLLIEEAFSIIKKKFSFNGSKWN